MVSVWRVVLVLTLLLVPFSAGADPSTSDLLRRFEWTVPAEHAGPMAVTLTMSLHEEARCTAYLTLSGTTGPQTPARFWSEYDGPDGASRALAADWRPLSVQHTDLSVDVEQADHGPWTSSTQLTRWWPNGWHRFAWAAEDLRAWDDGETAAPPFKFVFTCDRLFSVGQVRQGDQVLLFDAQEVAGTSGLHLDAQAASVGVDSDDVLETTLTSEFASLRVQHETNGGHSEGFLRITRPGGTELRSLSGDVYRAIDDGPGTYRIGWDRRAIGDTRLVGALYGMESVVTPA